MIIAFILVVANLFIGIAIGYHAAKQQFLAATMNESDK
jgi:uncharacterized membrane protein